MKLIIGLGNPGKKYELTRHNAGFLAIDWFLKDKPVISCQSKFDAIICEYHEDGNKVLFVKPTTFMNLSGRAISQLTNFYNLSAGQDLLVLHDEIDLPLGKIKFTEGSSAAGHNGVQSIIDELGTKNFHRLRIGVETRENKSIPPTESFVLQKFTDEELQLLQEKIFTETNAIVQKFIKKENASE